MTKRPLLIWNDWLPCWPKSNYTKLHCFSKTEAHKVEERALVETSLIAFLFSNLLSISRQSESVNMSSPRTIAPLNQ